MLTFRIFVYNSLKYFVDNVAFLLLKILTLNVLKYCLNYYSWSIFWEIFFSYLKLDKILLRIYKLEFYVLHIIECNAHNHTYTHQHPCVYTHHTHTMGNPITLPAFSWVSSITFLPIISTQIKLKNLL